MGLGLTISKLIVQALGGEIDVQSRVNVGSNFFFTLPLDQDLPILEGDGIQPIHAFPQLLEPPVE